MLFSNSIVPALWILNVYAYVRYANVYACSVQPEATHQLTSTPPWLMASPSTVLGLPGQSTHSSTGWALSQVDDCIFFLFSCHLLKVILANVFSRHDSGTVPVYGPCSKDILQEPTIFSKDTFQSTKRRQRRKEENMKETTLLIFLLCICILQKQILVFSFWKKNVELDGQSMSFFSWNRIWANVLRNSVSSHHLSGKNKNKTAYRHLKEMTHRKNYNCTEKNKLKILNSALPKSIQYLWWKGTVSFVTASRAGQQLGAVCILSSTSCRRHRLFWFFVFGLIFRRRPWTCGSKTEKQLHWQYDIMLKKTKICFLNV